MVTFPNKGNTVRGLDMLHCCVPIINKPFACIAEFTDTETNATIWGLNNPIVFTCILVTRYSHSNITFYGHQLSACGLSLYGHNISISHSCQGFCGSFRIFLPTFDYQGTSAKTIQFYNGYLKLARSVIGLQTSGQDISRFLSTLSCSSGGKHAYYRTLRAFYSWLCFAKSG